MGIQLSDHERSMIKQVADFRSQNVPITSYLFGYIMSRLDSFVIGGISREQLAEDYSLVGLLQVLDARCSTEQLLQIVAGTRELPGEDVPSGQSS